MVAWAVWDCNSNRELVSLLLTRPFGIYHFLFLDLISILFWHMSIKVLVLVLVHCVPCTSLTWWRNIDVTEITPFTVYMTLSPRCRERRQILSLQRGHPIRQIWIRWTTASGVYFKRGLPFADPWCEVERTSSERVEAAGPHHHRSSSDCAVV